MRLIRHSTNQVTTSWFGDQVEDISLISTPTATFWASWDVFAPYAKTPFTHFLMDFNWGFSPSLLSHSGGLHA